MPRGDGDVREDAEPETLVARRMVPGRANERIRVVDLAREHRLDGHDHAAGRQGGDLEGVWTERGSGACEPSARIRIPLDSLDVLLAVDAPDLHGGGRSWQERR